MGALGPWDVRGVGLTLGEAYRCTVVRRDNGIGGPAPWEASVNLQKLGPFPDKDSAIRAVEFAIEQGMKRLLEDWAVFQATRILGIKKGKRAF